MPFDISCRNYAAAIISILITLYYFSFVKIADICFAEAVNFRPLPSKNVGNFNDRKIIWHNKICEKGSFFFQQDTTSDFIC